MLGWTNCSGDVSQWKLSNSNVFCVIAPHWEHLETKLTGWEEEKGLGKQIVAFLSSSNKPEGLQQQETAL